MVIHFQQISKAAALYAKALLGGVRGALEIYRRVDTVINCYRWVDPTPEEKWHYHREGNLTVALRSSNLPQEAWQCAKLLRANHYGCVSLCESVVEHWRRSESDQLLESPPATGPTVGQVTVGPQNWKCAGRRLVEIRGRLPTANVL